MIKDMSDREQDEAELRITTKAGHMGCAYLFFTLIGAVTVLASSFGLVINLLEGSPGFGTVIALFILIMGLIFVLAGISGRRMDFKS